MGGREVPQQNLLYVASFHPVPGTRQRKIRPPPMAGLPATAPFGMFPLSTIATGRWPRPLASSHTAPARPSGKKMTTILMIEDSTANCILVERVLAPHGYRMLHATTGESGIKMAVEQIPDLVLIDIGLPDIDGHTVVTLLKQVSELHATRLVALTAWPPEITAEMIERYGYDGIINKPIDIREFPAQIAAYLSA